MNETPMAGPITLNFMGTPRMSPGSGGLADQRDGRRQTCGAPAWLYTLALFPRRCVIRRWNKTFPNRVNASVGPALYGIDGCQMTLQGKAWQRLYVTAGREARPAARSGTAAASHAAAGSHGSSALNAGSRSAPVATAAMRSATAAARTEKNVPRRRPWRRVRPSATAAV